MLSRVSLAVIALLLAALPGAAAAEASVTPGVDDLYAGWLKMYDLQFGPAHTLFSTWEKTHSTNPMGPVSHAAGYLFAEFARLGVLESELFVEDHTFLHRKKLVADATARANFMRELDRADALTTTALGANTDDTTALLAKSLAFGLRSDYLALIERQSLVPLQLAKESRTYAQRALKVDPALYDAHLGPGVENYLLSLKPAVLRLVLSWSGAQADREEGIAQLKLTAEHGHYLEPFAKLLLAVASLRDKKPEPAKAILMALHLRFPGNPLYLKEVERINARPVR